MILVQLKMHLVIAVQQRHHVEDMFKFIAHGFTVLLAMEILHINDKDDNIAESHTSYEYDKLYLRRLARQIIMRIW